MAKIALLRDKYDLKMKVERFTLSEENEKDKKYIRS